MFHPLSLYHFWVFLVVRRDTRRTQAYLTAQIEKVKHCCSTLCLLRQYQVWYKERHLLNGYRWQSGEKWKGSNFVFVQETGEPMHPDSITVWLLRFSERHGLPRINPHAFRHTFASILISKGIDIVTVSKILGHEKVSTTTDIYAELMKQASEAASGCIADVVFEKGKIVKISINPV